MLDATRESYKDASGLHKLYRVTGFLAVEMFMTYFAVRSSAGRIELVLFLVRTTGIGTGMDDRKTSVKKMPITSRML